MARSWPEAELVLTRGLGHSRILRDPTVIRRAARFLARCVFDDRQRLHSRAS